MTHATRIALGLFDYTVMNEHLIPGEKVYSGKHRSIKELLRQRLLEEAQAAEKLVDVDQVTNPFPRMVIRLSSIIFYFL